MIMAKTLQPSFDFRVEGTQFEFPGAMCAVASTLLVFCP